VLNGRERREVIKRRRNRRFFLEPAGWSSMSASARVRFRLKGVPLADIGNERGGQFRGPAVNLNTEAREEDPSLGLVSSIVALEVSCYCVVMMDWKCRRNGCDKRASRSNMDRSG
jgi:hypothetical protein